MLIGAFLAVFFSSAADLPGHGFVHILNTFIEQSISEPERKKVMSGDVEGMKDALEDFSKALKQKGKQLAKINQDHDSTRVEFVKVLDELNRERSHTQKRVLALRFKIKGHMTRGEWQAAFGGL